jgi:superfamily I DNA and RNA helicase
MNNDEDNEGYSILDIIEKPIRDNDIFLISWYPWTWKTLVSWMKFLQSPLPKLYLTYAHMLVAYTKEGLWTTWNIYGIDKWLISNSTDGGDQTSDFKDKRKAWIKSIKEDSIWTTLFIDEAQDIPPEDIAKLSLKFSKVVICWDRDQAIYQDTYDESDFFHQYKESLHRYEPNLQTKRRIIGPYELKKNYRNTKPVFDFAKCFHPDSRRIEDIKIMKQWWEKPELRLWETNRMFDEVINFCINEIDSQNVVAIIVWNKEDITEVKNTISKGLKEKLWDDYNDELIQSYISTKSSRENEVQSENCMRASIIISSIYSMKWLEADDVIIWKIWWSEWWKNDSLSKNKYYVGFTRSRNNLIICQNNWRFWPYDVPENLYKIKKRDKIEPTEVDEDEYDEYEDLPF